MSWRDVAGVQPPITVEEFFACERLVRSSPAWLDAVRKRGVADPELPSSIPGRPATTGRPTIRAGCARPFEGLVALVDMDAMQVVEIEDHGMVPLPPRAGNYSAAALRDPSNAPYVAAGPRTDLRSLEVVQRQGPSFELRSHEVRGQKWRLRIGFTPREGLVLHTVT